MQLAVFRQSKINQPPLSLDANQDYAWKEQSYIVPSAAGKGIQWKASALYGLQRLERRSKSRQPATIVVPALYNCRPAEILALGWLNEIDFLAAFRQRIMLAAKVTGWDVFTFHTRHNLDAFFDTTIHAVRETWLNEGALNTQSILQTRKRFGPAYDYHRCEPRLVENLLIQFSLMDWMSVRAGERPLRFHVIGTALLSALVWSGALPLQEAIQAGERIGKRWDTSLNELVEEDLRRAGVPSSEDQLGWRRFQKVRQVVEGRAKLSLGVVPEDLPHLSRLPRAFWFSASALDQPVLIETVQDALEALLSMNLASWSPEVPKPVVDKRTPNRRLADRVRGWLVSPMHPTASACSWSVYNYLLATADASRVFIDNFASVGAAKSAPALPEVFPVRSETTYPNVRT